MTERVKDLARKIDETHDAVLEIRTLWNGGPGNWPPCQTGKQLAQDHENRIRRIERTVYMGLGMIVLIEAASKVWPKIL